MASKPKLHHGSKAKEKVWAMVYLARVYGKLYCELCINLREIGLSEPGRQGPFASNVRLEQVDLVVHRPDLALAVHDHASVADPWQSPPVAFLWVVARLRALSALQVSWQMAMQCLREDMARWWMVVGRWRAIRRMRMFINCVVNGRCGCCLKMNEGWGAMKLLLGWEFARVCTHCAMFFE